MYENLLEHVEEYEGRDPIPVFHISLVAARWWLHQIQLLIDE
jgi:hypothetical protein